MICAVISEIIMQTDMIREKKLKVTTKSRMLWNIQQLLFEGSSSLDGEV